MTQGQDQARKSKPPLKIKNFTSSGKRVEAVLELGENTHQVYFESDDYVMEPAWEALLPLTLLVAMRHASSLQLGAEIDPVLLDNLPAFQDRLIATDPGFSKIPIQGITPAEVPAARPGRVGLFFSGGVDSWYSLLDHLDEITDLVWVSGVDISLENPVYLEDSLDLVRRMADHFGKNLVTMRTNMRSFTDQYLNWNILLDSLMQSPAHLLGKDLAKIYLASAHASTNLQKYGLDPTLITLWSTSSLQVVHDSLEVERMEKTARVAQEQVALNNLRVCWKHPSHGLNCGACDKCVRTMISLEIVGALDRCPVFNRSLDLNLVARQFHSHDNLFYVRENLAAITASQGNSPLAQALRSSIRSSSRKAWFRAHFPWMSSLNFRLRRRLKRRGPSVNYVHK